MLCIANNPNVNGNLNVVTFNFTYRITQILYNLKGQEMK